MTCCYNTNTLLINMAALPQKKQVQTTFLPALTLNTEQVHCISHLRSVIPTNFRYPQYVHLIYSLLNAETTATLENHTATLL